MHETNLQNLYRQFSLENISHLDKCMIWFTLKTFHFENCSHKERTSWTIYAHLFSEITKFEENIKIKGRYLSRRIKNVTIKWTYTRIEIWDTICTPRAKSPQKAALIACALLIYNSKHIDKYVEGLIVVFKITYR